MTNWLSRDEQAAWRAWLDATLQLNNQLSRDLHEAHGLTLADYEILVHLSESADRRMRMSELAGKVLSSRSRLSHQIDRMERAALVSREHCVDDRRGSFAVLTDHGWDVLVKAAPDHVASVRRHLVDVLDGQELTALGASCRRISDRLQEQP